MDERSELEELRRLDELERKAAGGSPQGGISFAPSAEGQGYGPNGDRSLLGAAGHMAASSVLRPLAPAAAAAGAGFALGGPVGAGAGLGVYGGAKLGDAVLGLANMGGNAIARKMGYAGDSEPIQLTPYVDNGVGWLLDKVGVPRPDTDAERFVSSAVEGGRDALTGNEAGVAMKAIPQVAKLGQFLSAAGRPASAAYGAASGIGAEMGREIAPDSTYAPIIGGVAAPLFGMMAHTAVKPVINAVGESNFQSYLKGIPKLDPRQQVGQIRGAAQAAQQLQEAAGTEAQRLEAVKNLRDARANLTDPEKGAYRPVFRPTAGTASDNPGILGVEQGLVNTPEGMALFDRHTQNERALSANAGEMLKPEGAPISAAQQFMSDRLDQGIGAAQNNVRVAEGQASKAEQTFAERQERLRQLNDVNTANSASANVASTLDRQRQSADAIRKTLYDAVPQDVVVDVTSAKQAANRLAEEYSSRPGTMPPIIQRFADLPDSMSARAADNSLKDLYSDASQLSANLDHEGSRAVGLVRSALDDAVSAQESLSEPLRAARTYHRDVFAPTFQQGASESVLYGKGAGGAAAVSPEAALGKYVAPGQNQLREIKRLKNAVSIEFPEDATAAVPKDTLPPKTAKDIRDYAITQMASSLGQKPTGTAIRGWLAKNQNLVNEFPEVKTEIQKMANRINSAAEARDVMAGELKARQGELATTQANAENGSIGKFAGFLNKDGKYRENDAVNHLSGLFKGGSRVNLPQEINKLVSEAKQDPTGAAMQGLRNATSRALEKSVTNDGTSLQLGNDIKPLEHSDTPVSRAVLNSYLKAGTDSREALAQVYSPEEMAAWDRLRKQADVDNRLDRRAVNNSQTSRLTALQEVQDVSLRQSRALRAVGFGHIIPELAGITRFIGKTASLAFSADPEKFKNALLTRAMLDPQLAEALLTQPTRQNTPYFRSVIQPKLKQLLLSTNEKPDKTNRAKKILGE